ncbi:MAG: thioredoxin domain-containing protein [Myxococcota bacterium]
MRRITAVLVLSLAFVACDEDERTGGQVETVDVEAESRITELPGVNTSNLSGPGHRRMWEQLVNDLLSPCGDPISVAECVASGNACGACRTAAEYVGRLVVDGLERGEIRELYRARFSGDPVDIPIEGAPTKGALMGPAVTIVEFSDFQCPYCGLATPVIREVLHDFEEDVRVVFKHYPLSSHDYAIPAAKAAVAAMRQNKFWEMHDLLFEHQDALTPSDLRRYATQLELDMERFEADMNDPETQALVELNQSEGRAVGVQGTPSIYINGRRFEEPFPNLAAYVREAIALAR